MLCWSIIIWSKSSVQHPNPAGGKDFFRSVCALLFVVIVLVIYTFMGYPPDLYVLQLIYYSFCIFMLILAMTYLTGAVVVFFRDLSQIINIALQVGVWVTPIMWDFSDLGLTGILKQLLKLNPVFILYRDTGIP